MNIIVIMRAFWLKLTDGRLRAVTAALTGCGRALGDLENSPAAAPSLLRRYRQALESARSADSSPEAGRALAAADDFAARLEKTFSDMALLDARTDAPCREALLRLQLACALSPRLLSRYGRARASRDLLSHCAAGRKALALAAAAAAAAAAADPAGFPRNLKFSSIYSGLDSVFEALERCAGSLYLI